MNKNILGKISIVFRMLLCVGFLIYSCGSFSCLTTQAATLPELNQSTAATRSYTFSENENVTLEENMGITSPGTFTITGKNKDSNSILFNSYSGFVVSQIQTTLKISNVTIKNAVSDIGSVIRSSASDANITLSNVNFESNSILSHSNALGGAIYNNGIMKLTNTSFKGNYAVTDDSGSSAKGGAIYTRKSIELIADSDNVEIVDNYTQDSSGTNDNAIYVDNSDATLTMTAKNKGKIMLHDNIDGANGYNVEISGDGTGKLGLYNSINNAGKISVEDVDVTTANAKIENVKLDNLEVGDNVNFTVDVDLSTGKADTITAQNGTGTVNVSEISVIADQTGDSTTVQVLKDAGSMTLNIDQLQAKQVSELQSTMYNSSILADSISLGTTDTSNDSITINGWRDVLFEMVQDASPSHMVKNFIFDTDTEYVLTKDLNPMAQESILTIFKTTDAEYGVINANGHSMFKMIDPISSVTLRNIEIKNASTTSNGSVAYLANNTAAVNVINSKIDNNSADGNGGAIYASRGTVNISKSTVSNNTSGGDGGALYVTGEANAQIVNSDFKNNTADGKGGAIYTERNMTVTAQNGTTTFEGNTANGENNAIYVGKSNATVTFNAISDGKIYLNDKISGTDNGYGLNFTGTSSGNIYLNNYVTNANASLSKTTLHMGQDDYLSGNSMNMKGGTLNMINGSVGSTDFSKFTMSGNNKIKVDVDLKHKSMDRITADSYGSSSGTLNVTKMKLMSDAKHMKTRIYFADSPIRRLVKTPIKTVQYSKIYRYIVTYNKENGYFTFHRGSGWDAMSFNPSVLAGAIAQQVAYMNQIQNHQAAFYHSDEYMMLPRSVRENTGNVYNEEENTMTYLQIQEEMKSIWVRPYASFEHFTLNRGPKVHSTNFGTLAGSESDMIDIGKGFKLVYGGYMGYNGNSYNYETVDTLQQGGVFGAIAYLYKGNFFNTSSINVGWMLGDAYTPYGHDYLNMIMSGFADRIGYNFELANGKLIIQPSVTLGYSFVYLLNYRTGDDVKITSDPLHGVLFAPGIKIIGNLANGWQPYATVSVIANFVDKTHYYADNVQAPLMSLDPYVEYGLGIQKRWDDKYSGFAQATIRAGGRKGGALLFGFRYMLGQILNVPHKLSHTDARPRSVLFKEKRRPHIVVEPVKRKFDREKPQKTAKEDKPKFKFSIIDIFKKSAKKMIYSYNTDVSAKVVTDVYPDGVIMPSINGMKDKSGMDFRDEDRINKVQTYEKPLGEKTTHTKQVIKEQIPTPKVNQGVNKGVNKGANNTVNKATSTTTVQKPAVKQEVQKPVVKQEVQKPVTEQKTNVQKPAVTEPKAQKPTEVQKPAVTEPKAQKQAEVQKPVQKPTEVQKPAVEKPSVTQKPAEVQKPAETQKPTAAAKPAVKKTDYIQRKPKPENKTLNMNQSKFNSTNTTQNYKDYGVEVVDFRF